MLLKCWTCGKQEAYEGEHYVGQCPYALEMCVTESDRNEVTDEQVFCDECYTNAIGDI